MSDCCKTCGRVCDEEEDCEWYLTMFPYELECGPCVETRTQENEEKNYVTNI